jgi:hypothetical protein
MKIRCYNSKGRETFVSAGQIIPAGWFDGQCEPFTREMRVELVVVRGEDLDMDEDDHRNVRKFLAVVPNITAEQAAAEAAAAAAAQAAALSAALGGRKFILPAGDSAEDALRAGSDAGSVMARHMALLLASAPSEAVVVFGNTDKFYPRLHLAAPDGREWRIVFGRPRVTTPVERDAEVAAAAAKEAAAKEAAANSDASAGGSGYGRHSKHGGLEALDGPYNKADVDWAFDARNTANQWND